MNTARIKQLVFVSGLVSVFLLGGRSAQAESSPIPDEYATSPDVILETQPLVAPEQAFDQEITPPIEVVPAPGTVETSAASLQPEMLTAQTEIPAPATTPDPIETTPGTTPVPPETTSPVISPGRATQSGPSYVGVGGNIGFGGRTDLGRGSFTAFSKIGLTNNLSARPAVMAWRRPAVLLPVTVDFPLGSVVDGRLSAAPYIGGGIVISTGRDSVVRALLTGGVDVPLNEQFTANAGVNVGFFGKTEVGLRLGVGYNF
ncbi:hypothetical protein ACN4EK_00585 [Pantanalinema rosaneae CENA516]|uniref:hypothetical protein n=1 Tax=Pantanalinema rosaneae TaxID=1620701 RepID=UPI003D6E9D2E